MKKLLPLLLVSSLLAMPMIGRVYADEQPQPTAPPAAASSVQSNAAEGFRPGSVPADAQAMDAIQLPIHALVLSMAEHQQLYDDRSDAFVWNALYYALSMYGQADDRTELTGDGLLLPSETAQDFLQALFTRRNTLPPIPEALAHCVSYDPVSDLYRLAAGDFGLTELQPGPLTCAGDGTCVLEGALTSPEDGSILYTLRVTLVENETMFGYSILDMTLN